jgi:alpha-galactosidase
VAEVFTRPGKDDSRHYKEFEISPNGDWLDLDISAGQKRLLMCDIKSRVVTNPEERIWIAELALPMNSLVAEFDPSLTWRINLFRIEGREPNRFYSAWRPTYTPQPNFHVPELFGELRFS